VNRRACTVTGHLAVVPGTSADYDRLRCFHYRNAPCRPYVAIYAMRDNHVVRRRLVDPVGVIVYVNPAPNSELRTAATGGMFSGLGDRRLQMQMINRNIRTIARVIIDPRYRGLGLASRLVAGTMGLLNVPVIEATAVMGAVNPFFERAGMRAYPAGESAAVVQLKEAFSSVGIEAGELIDPAGVQDKLDRLPPDAAAFIEYRMQRFLARCANRRYMPPGAERTRFILARLTPHRTYYIWFNPQRQIDPATATPPEKRNHVVFSGRRTDENSKQDSGY